jgi:hypothetical protein
MNVIELPDAIEPTTWNVVFHTVAPNPLYGFLAFGHFKHVSAFAYVPGLRAWLLYDAELNGTRLRLLPHGERGIKQLMAYSAGCVILTMEKAYPVDPLPLGGRLGFYCVPAIRHLLGVRCRCLRPDALFKAMLRSGGVLVNETAVGATNPGGPKPGERTASGANGSH